MCSQEAKVLLEEALAVPPCKHHLLQQHSSKGNGKEEGGWGHSMVLIESMSLGGGVGDSSYSCQQHQGKLQYQGKLCVRSVRQVLRLVSWIDSNCWKKVWCHEIERETDRQREERERESERVCVCVRERENKRERASERELERVRQKERTSQRETDSERERETERERESERERKREIEDETRRERERDREREGESA